MASIGSLSVDVVARTDKFDTRIKKSQGVVKSLHRTLDRAKGVLVGFGTALLAAASVRGLKNTADDIDRISKAADRMGVTTEALAGLEHAASLSDVSTGRLSMGLTRINVLLSDAERGSKPAIAAFQRINLKFKDLVGLPADEVLKRIADQINALPTPAERAGAAAAIFGKKAGPELQNLLKEGSQGIDAMIDDAKRLGLTFDAVAGKQVEAANDAITRLTASISGLSRAFLIKLAPGIEKVVNDLTSLIEKLERALGLTQDQAALEKYTAALNKLSDEDAKAVAKLHSSVVVPGNASGIRHPGFYERGLVKFINSKNMRSRGGEPLTFAHGEGDEFQAAINARLDRIAAGNAARYDKSIKRQQILETPGGWMAAGMTRAAEGIGDAVDVIGRVAAKGKSLEREIFKRGAMGNLFGFGPPGEIKAAKEAKLAVASPFATGLEGGGQFAALEKGSAAAFSQERRSQAQQQLVAIGKQQLSESQKQTIALIQLEKNTRMSALQPANVA